MVRIYALLALFYVAFFLYVLLDVALSEPSLVRNLPKLTWVLLVVLVPLAGGIAWLVAGRPEHATATPGSTRSRRRGSGRKASPHGSPGRRNDPPPLGPDDDPEFLRRLDERLHRTKGDENDEDDEDDEG